MKQNCDFLIRTTRSIAGILALLLCASEAELAALIPSKVLTVRSSSRQPSPQKETLSLLHNMTINGFAARDARDLWVSGERWVNDEAQGVLVHTSDGGAHWTTELNFPGAFFYSVKFVTPLRGFVIGVVTDGALGLLYSTEDGGKNWRRAEIAINDHLSRLHFIDASRGWVLGSKGTILRTNDGGRTWSVSRIEGGSYLRSISATGPNDVWVTGDDRQVFRSLDGGETWTNVGNSLAGLFRLWDFNEINFRQVLFTDVKKGFILVEALRASGEPGGGYHYLGILLETQNGGAAWSPRFLTEKLGLSSGQFLDANNAWLIPTWGWQKQILLRSADGGTTWKSLKYPEDIGYPFLVTFIDSQTGWLVGDQGDYYSQLYGTRDGGKTWLRYTK